MAKKSFIKTLLERRIPQILGSYLVAGTSLILFIEYLIDKYQFPSHYPTLALFALIGILPSVVILSYFHGAPGKDEWTKVERIGIPINVLFIAGILFFGDSLNIWKLDQGYQQRNIRETFLINMHSSSYLYNLIDSIKEKKEYEDFPEMQVFSDSLLNDTKNYVTAYLETKFFNLDVDLHYPGHQIQPILDKFPPYEMLEAGFVEWGELENNALEVYEFYKNDGIYLDDIMNIVFMNALFPEEKQWGRTFIYNFYELYEGEKLNPWWSSSPEVDWGDDNSTVIKKEAATYLYREIYELRFGSDYIGEVVEIVDLDLVKIYLSNTNIYKGVKVKLAKNYASGEIGRKTWMDDLKYIDVFISHDEILINKYNEIMNENKVLLDSLINNYSSIFAKDSILLAGGGSNYWQDGMNNYYGKILSITNNEAIVKVNKLEYPFGRMRVGDEVYIVDDY